MREHQIRSDIQPSPPPVSPIPEESESIIDLDGLSIPLDSSVSNETELVYERTTSHMTLDRHKSESQTALYSTKLITDLRQLQSIASQWDNLLQVSETTTVHPLYA